MQFSTTSKKLSTSVAALAAAGAATGTSVAADESFAGLYAGLSILGGASGYLHSGSEHSDYSINNVKPRVGGFVGYNWVGGADGRRVIGVEFAYENSEIGALNGDADSDYAMTNQMQVKLRYGRSLGGAGSSFGSTLIYGFVSMGAGDNGYEGSFSEYGAGRTIGIGIGGEHNITNQLAVGLEAHSQRAQHNGYYDYEVGAINTVTFRGIMRF